MLKLGPSWWVLVDFYLLSVGSSPRDWADVPLFEKHLRSLKLTNRPPENRPSQKEIPLSTMGFCCEFQGGL